MGSPDDPLRAAEILRELLRAGVDFVVIGGIAVQAHGYLRATADVDIVPRPLLLNLSRLAEALGGLEAEAWRSGQVVTDPHVLKTAPRLAMTTRAGRLDLLNITHVAGAPPSFDELRDRALVVELDDLEIPVAGLDDLIRMKRSAGRPHDLRDIAALTRTDEELEDEAGEST